MAQPRRRYPSTPRVKKPYAKKIQRLTNLASDIRKDITTVSDPVTKNDTRPVADMEILEFGSFENMEDSMFDILVRTELEEVGC